MDPDTLAEIREWIGSTPDEADVEEVYDRVGTVKGTALSILRTRRADLLNNPTTWAVAGEYSESNAGRLADLDSQIAVLEQATGETSSTARLVRCDTGR